MARIATHAIFVIFHKASLRSLASRTPPLASLTDRVSIWFLSLGMVLVFLILVLFLIQVVSSRPKNTHPTESAWYCYTLPHFKIVSRDRPAPILSRTCRSDLDR
jgi:hypothetical protein